MHTWALNLFIYLVKIQVNVHISDADLIVEQALIY